MMKKLTCLIVLVLVFFGYQSVPIHANSAARGWCEYGNQTVATGGLTSSTKVQKSYPQCTITVYLAGTVTPATIYSDNAGSPTPLANPFTGQANGSWQFYAAQGLYDVVLSGASLPVPLTLSGVSLFDSTAITTVAAVTLTVSGATTLTAVAADSFTMTAVLFAALGTPSNGVIKYCSNCTVASPCAGSGTGALAKRLNGVWVCN
jgi:hypothetical protein